MSKRNPSIGNVAYECGLKSGVRQVADFLERAQAGRQIIADDCVQAAEDFFSLLLSDLYRRRELNIIACPAAATIQKAASQAARTLLRAYTKTH